LRGVCVAEGCLCPPQKPERDAWGSALEAVEAALQLEKSVNQALLELHRLAADKGDPHVSHP
ncbi:FRI2 protein, partial [Atlantisia rogersi]|nr:FRI2 protein [Atlantisia rogersi]